MAEEHGFRSTEGHHRLCMNNCGFFGSPATQNMCSKCFAGIKSTDSPLFSNPSTTVATPHPSTYVASAPERIVSSSETAEVVVSPPQHQTTVANRCSTCRKKVGLTGFRCRCGTTFCGTHRYPEKHGCTFDFKTVGKEAIAKANHVVIAEKLEKI